MSCALEIKSLQLQQKIPGLRKDQDYFITQIFPTRRLKMMDLYCLEEAALLLVFLGQFIPEDN